MLLVENSLTNPTADEFKVGEVVRVDVRGSVYHVCHVVFTGSEKCYIGNEIVLSKWNEHGKVLKYHNWD